MWKCLDCPRQSNPRGLPSALSNSALQDSGVWMQFVFSSYNDETDLTLLSQSSFCIFSVYTVFLIVVVVFTAAATLLSMFFYLWCRWQGVRESARYSECHHRPWTHDDTVRTGEAKCGNGFLNVVGSYAIKLWTLRYLIKLLNGGPDNCFFVQGTEHPFADIFIVEFWRL